MDTLDNFLNLGKDGQNRYSLGAGLYKLRLATKKGKGKSGGSRSILAFKQDERIIWLHLFDKNEKGNVTATELKKLKHISGILLEISQQELNTLLKIGEIEEVSNNEQFRKHDT